MLPDAQLSRMLSAPPGRRRPPPCDRVATGYRLNESLSRDRGGLVAGDAANAALNALRLGDTLKFTAERPA
jgi:hypothetical protein